MSNTELVTAEKFIRDKLKASSALTAIVGDRIYRRKAKKSTVYPCIVLFFYTGNDEFVGGGKRFYTDMTYIVKAVDQAPSASEDAVDEIAALIDVALTNITDDEVFVCRRTSPFDNEYTINSIDYEERGGIYNLAVKGG